MASSNLPRHGDNIIVKQGSSLTASFQFQQFLDELGALINPVTTTFSLSKSSVSDESFNDSEKLYIIIDELEKRIVELESKSS